MWIIFPYIGNVIIPTDYIIFFRGIETTNQLSFPMAFQEGCVDSPLDDATPSRASAAGRRAAVLAAAALGAAAAPAVAEEPKMLDLRRV